MVDQLSEEQIAEFKEAFMVLDQEGNGNLKTSELSNIMKSLAQNPTDSELQVLIKEIDPDGNGTFNFDAFLAILAGILKDTNDEEVLREAFRVFDHGRDGLISASELRYKLTTAGDKLSQEEWIEMIRQVEIDDDSFIKYEEFISKMISK